MESENPRRPGKSDQAKVEDRREPQGRGITRREFVGTGTLLGSCGLFLGGVDDVQRRLNQAVTGDLSDDELAQLVEGEAVVYSVCLQCHTACPIKARVYDGVLGKIDGNPYSPQTMLTHIRYETPASEPGRLDGKLCPKGQAGIQSLYDPYRIRTVLKRAGRRGENKWETIPFDRAIQEIVRGGRLFAQVPGEEGRHVPGIAESYAVRDPELANTLAAESARVASGELTLEDFKARHRGHLDLLIDPDHPDLGPKNNQFVFLAGRIEHGRKELSQRWLRDSFGSVNWYEHTTVCEQSHHIAYQQMTHQWNGSGWSGGKTHMKPDARHCEFVMYFGTSPFESNFGPPIMAEKITEGLVSGRLKIAVADPRLSKTASKAWKWLPVNPGGDAALALAMTRWIFENDRFDAGFLTAANRAAANEAGEVSWTDASLLVEVRDDGPAGLLRADRAGVGEASRFIAMVDGVPVSVGPNGDQGPVNGDLFVDTTLAGTRVKSVLQLVREEAFSRSMDEWAELCGIPVEDIAEVARELTSHGKRAAVELYRGAVQHTNGYHTAQAIIGLNLLIGNVDWVGGLQAGGGHWHETGDKRPGPFNLGGLHPRKTRSFGIKLTREGSAYENSTLFDGYPAQRPWYSFTGNVYQEVLPAAEAAYPYPIKALFLHKGTPGFSTPGANSQLAVLRDLDTVPLLLACDIVIGESSMYADYLFPDLSVWERWGTPHTTPDALTKASKVRQPIVAPIPEMVRVFGERQPISMEAVMLAIAEEMGLPGHGPDGFGEGAPFRRPEDFFLRLATNLAAGDGEGEELPDASPAELEFFLHQRRHLPQEIYDVERWAQVVGEEWWPKVVYLLNRGGRYENPDRAYAGDKVAHQFKAMIHFYAEPVALARNAMTGQRFAGLGTYLPVTDSAGREVLDREFPLTLITFKEITGGQSRTVADYWLQSVLPENRVLINRATAQDLGLRNGQEVRIRSASNPEGVWELGNGIVKPVSGKVRTVQGLRPGVVAVSWHFGHWAYGAGDVVIDGRNIKGDPRRGTGLCTNAVLRIDPTLGNVCLSDPVGGSSSFYDTQVTVEPA